MTLSRSITHWTAAAALLAPLLAACAPLHVRSYVERGSTLSSAYTYRWAAPEAQATGDPRLDGNPFFERRLIEAADRELRTRGFERRDTDATDLILQFHASVTQQLDLPASQGAVPACEACNLPSVYDAGTILFDFVDRRSGALVWRAWAEGSIDGMVDDQRWLESHIDRAVARIVETLPHRGESRR